MNGWLVVIPTWVLAGVGWYSIGEIAKRKIREAIEDGGFAPGGRFGKTVFPQSDEFGPARNEEALNLLRSDPAEYWKQYQVRRKACLERNFPQ